MTNTTNIEAWARGCISKRTPDALSILSDILNAGLYKGQITANDVQDKVYSEPNIIGSTFRLLPRLGFRCDYTQMVKAQGRKKHGRNLPTWVLDERWKAETFLRVLRSNMLAVQDDQFLLKV